MRMNPGMKMMLMQRGGERRTNRSEYGGDSERRMIGYDRDYATENRRYAEREGMENRMRYDHDPTENRRRRDPHGRYMEGGDEVRNSHYTNYPWSEEMMGGGYETESRRQRDSRGRYMMGRMEDEPEMRSQTWYPPNMHGGSGYSFGDVYADIHAPNAMNRPMSGGMYPEMSAPVDEHTARMWVQKMDGGEKWKPEQIDQLRQAICPECSKWEFYTAINAMYSDYCETAKKMGMDKPEFYAYMAKDFLKDKDAKPHKLRRYMEHIAK